MAVDCAALPGATLEQELFGREGAHGAAAIGRVELAHTGTLFLDRVEEASAAVQTRLLRLLETGFLERAGEAAPRRVDVRVVVAATRPLAAEARAGRFREDLCRRLQVVRIALPPLRERRGDVPLLADYFLAKLGPPGATFTPAALAALQACDWAGNVRQLENLVRQIVAGRADWSDPAIGPELLPAELLTGAPAPQGRPARPGDDRRALMLRALSGHGGNRTAAARALGIGRATFYRWWREAGLGPD